MKRRSCLLKFKSFLLLFLLIPIWAQAFEKDFTTVNERVPFEFVLLFDSLKNEFHSPSEQLKMVGLCKELNDNLGLLQKEHIFMLMKTEVIKNVLEHKFARFRQFDINAQLITKLENDFDEKQKGLNRFSKWIWQSIMAELRYRQTLGILTGPTFSPKLYEGAKYAEAMRFERYLQYLLPWIDRMDNLTSQEFNQLAKEVSWAALIRLNERSMLFKRFASTASGSLRTTIFNIPAKLLELHPEDIKKMQNDEVPLSLQEQSAVEKSDAEVEMEKITPTDLSPLSEDVAKELEGKNP